MDKNTVTGLVLIAGLLFGFMLCNRDKKPVDTDTQAQTEQAAKTADPADKAATLDVTALSRNIAAGVTKASQRAADGSHTLSMQGTTLSVDSLGHISGSVTANGNTMAVEAVLDTANTTISGAQRAAAVAVINDVLGQTEKYSDFAQFVGGTADTLTVDNGKMRVTFSSLGGRVEKVVLPGYKNETTEPARDVCLFDASTAAYEFELETASQRIATGNLNFRMTRANDTTVVMSLPMQGGAELSLRYTVHPDNYLVSLDMEQKGMDRVIPTTRNNMRMRWHQTMMRNEKGRTFEERNSAVYYKFEGEKPEDMSASDNDSENVTGNLQWVAFKNQFFSSVVIAKPNFNAAKLESEVIKKSATELKDMTMDATLPYSSTVEKPVSMAFFFGPNSYPLLSSLDDHLPQFAAAGDDSADLQLNKLVPLGWGIFGWINRFVVIPVFSFLSGFISNYGIIILILTLLVKLVLFPLTYKSYMSQAKMRVLAPEIKEINDKYPGQENAMKRQQETMQLYSRAGASPFSGCLPMMLQMPVLIAMFSFFPSAIELRGQSFLWAHDLSAPDYLFTLPFSLPFLGNHLSLFCLLMTVVNILYTRINMQNQPSSSAMPGMKWMMYLMPVMFLFFFNDYASGLSYYYFLSLLITIVQTYAFRWFVDEKKVRAELLENAKKPRKKGGLMARLEAAQKKQEAMMREQQQRNRRR